MLAEDVVVAQRVAEEAEAVETAAARLLRVGVAGEARDHGDVGVHRMAERHAVVRLDDVVVLGHPLDRLALVDEGEGERAERRARAAWWMVSRLEQATQIGGCGFCTDLGTRLRQGMEKYLPW